MFACREGLHLSSAGASHTVVQGGQRVTCLWACSRLREDGNFQISPLDGDRVEASRVLDVGIRRSRI